MTWGLWYWPLALITVAVVAGLMFFPAEIYAVVSNHSNTLSDYSRYQLGLTTALGKETRLHTVTWWITFLVWSGFIVWITGHIWYVKW
jgi:hypothetical protein